MLPSWFSQSSGTDSLITRQGQPRGLGLGKHRQKGQGWDGEAQGLLEPKAGILDQPRSQEGLPGGGGTGADRNERHEEKRKVCWAGAAAVGVFGGKSVVSVQGTERY